MVEPGMTATNPDLVELARLRREKELCARLLELLDRPVELKDRLEGALDFVLQLVGFKSGGLTIVTRERKALLPQPQILRGISPAILEELAHLSEGLSGPLLEQGRAMLIEDLAQDPRVTHPALREAGLRTTIIVPLRARGEITALLYLLSPSCRTVPDELLALLQRLGDQLGVVVEGYQLLQRERRRFAQLRLVSAIAKRASSILDPERLLAEAAAEIQRSFNYHDVLIFSVDHERQELVRRAWAGHYSRRGPKDARLPLSERGLLTWVARHGQTALVNDVRSDPRYEAFFPETRSELCVPMKRDGLVIGGINVESVQADAFDETDAIVLEALADQLVVALANAELYQNLEEEVAQRTAELEAERDRLRFVTEAMGAGLAIISKDYRTIWANDYLKEVFGEVEGKPCYEAYNRQPKVCPWCAVRRVFETGEERAETEAVGKDKAGRTVWSKLVATPLRDERGEIIAALEVVMPITERKRMEEALRTLSRVALKIQGVLDEEGLLELAAAELARAGFRLTFWAVEGETLLRRYSSIPPEEIMTLYELLGSGPGEFRAPISQSPLVEQALKEHRIVASSDLEGSLLLSRLYRSHPELIPTMEERVRGVLYAPLPLGGEPRWLMTATLAQMDEDELGALELFARHLSTALENARLFRRLEASYEELKRAQEGLLRAERLATLGQLAGAIAHNLRNPLGVIKNSAFYLKTRLRGREAREHLELIEQQVERADRRIADLLNFTYQRPLKFERVELRSLIDRLIEQLDLPRGLELRRAFPAEPLHVEADREQLLQACQNIVVNAIEALGGRGKLQIRAYPLGSEAALEFEDDGPGLPPEEAARVFEPLFTTKAQGTGLGLTITKQIIEAHGGRISFESALGRGSRVTIRLPRKGD